MNVGGSVVNQPIDMNTPRAQRNGIKLPKIVTGSSPLGRESSVLSRNSGGLQSSLMSVAKSRPAGMRNHPDKLSVDMSSPNG